MMVSCQMALPHVELEDNGKDGQAMLAVEGDVVDLIVELSCERSPDPS